FRLFEVFREKYGFEFSYWDGENEADIEKLIKPNTKGIFIESPTNPLMQTVDIKKISAIANEHQILHIVDSTLFTPYIQRPLELGAHVVIHSATKYLAGHNDVLAGLVIVNDEELAEEIAFLHNSTGAVLAPYDSWSLIRGMKTLALRMKQHEENATRLVAYLNTHPLVTEVYYPGRGGMLSFEVEDAALVEP